MQIPKTFDDALWETYSGQSDINKFFIEQKPFIMRLVRHANKYKHWSSIIDEEDLFQEACIWLLNYMWEWNEENGVELSTYVVYNVGVRLRNLTQKDKATKRALEKPTLLISYQHRNKSRSNRLVVEECFIPSRESTPEQEVILRRACSRANKELSLMARKLLDALLLEEGNISAATRRMQRELRRRISTKNTELISYNSLKHKVFKNFLPEIQSIFERKNII